MKQDFQSLPVFAFLLDSYKMLPPKLLREIRIEFQLILDEPIQSKTEWLTAQINVAVITEHLLAHDGDQG